MTAPLLSDTLAAVARRYRVPDDAARFPPPPDASPATTLAIVIERAREAVARGEHPDAALQHIFTAALARLIQDAMRPEYGDAVFQALAYRDRSHEVREYVSLLLHARQDRRTIDAAINAFAHPAKQARIAPGRERNLLESLHALTASQAWSALRESLQHALAAEGSESPLSLKLGQLLHSTELSRLQRLESLAADEGVRQYRLLWNRHGNPGSAEAVAHGVASKKRGAAVEALATQVIELLAQRLNEADGAAAARVARYRVVSSMRVPSAIPASHDRAKTEWDVVLLKRATTRDGSEAWDICLLVEAKASVDAATTDFLRLSRGLDLLAHADANTIYPFRTQQGTVLMNGASLRSLRTDDLCTGNAVLYCCDAPTEAMPRLLSAAGRMQLLSAGASVAFANALHAGERVDHGDLHAVWQQLIESPKWRALLNQYPALCRVRELIVHVEDLQSAIESVTRKTRERAAQS